MKFRFYPDFASMPKKRIFVTLEQRLTSLLLILLFSGSFVFHAENMYGWRSGFMWLVWFFALILGMHNLLVLGRGLRYLRKIVGD